MRQRFRYPDGSPTSLCFFLPRTDSTTCNRRRSCEDCLRMPGCMLSQYGECVNKQQDGYNSGMNFRLAQDRNLTVLPGVNQSVAPPQQWHFPALEATYCASNDATCGAWAATQRLESNVTIDSRYCVGASRCVTISVCEASREQVQRCFVPLDWSDAAFDIGINSSMLWIILGTVAAPLVLVLLCLGWCIFRNRKRRQEAAANASTHEPPRVQRRQDLETTDASVPRAPLDLAGWRVQHAERVEREKLRLAGAGDVNVVIDLQTQTDSSEYSDATSYVRVDDDANGASSSTAATSTVATAPSTS
ncbi:hypothetical protein PINS_up001051 [Pythium insidiosum]|nr:hypothetical protein PINS_up001051 [Pythium insidiosum]